MHLLFTTWNHIIPIAIVTNDTLKIGDVVKIRKQKYFITCEPSLSSNRYYCVKTHKDAMVTNKVTK